MAPNAGPRTPLGRAAPGARPSPIQRLGEILQDTIDALLLWQERRKQRHQLSLLNDNLLKDIGVTRLDASDEWRKWPWQE